MPSTTAEMPDRSEREFLTIREASARYKVKADTIRAWIRKGVLPHERIGPYGIIRLRDVDLRRTVAPEDQDGEV